MAAGRMAAIGEAVAAIAHGIRNPLANIRAAAQVGLLECREASEGDCRACPSGANVAVNLGHVMSEVDRLDSRVSELLRFVRPVERPRERLDLNERRGLSTAVARSEQGLRVAEETSPDVALVDIRLPGIDGLEVLRPCGPARRPRASS